MNRYIIGGLAFVGLAILLIVLLLSGSSHHKLPYKTPLVDYANTNAEVEMVIDGPIVAPINHNTLEVTISQFSASADLIQGYDNNVVGTQQTNNTENSFNNFLYALYYAGYSHGTTSVFPSDIGLCAGGERYDFYLKENDQTIQHYWLTSCSGEPRTYTGNLSATIDLFNAQMPNLSQLTTNANL